MSSQFDHERGLNSDFDQLGNFCDYFPAANELASFDALGLNGYHAQRQGSVLADHDAGRSSRYERSSQTDKKGRGGARAAVEGVRSCQQLTLEPKVEFTVHAQRLWRDGHPTTLETRAARLEVARFNDLGKREKPIACWMSWRRGSTRRESSNLRARPSLLSVA